MQFINFELPMSPEIRVLQVSLIQKLAGIWHWLFGDLGRSNLERLVHEHMVKACLYPYSLLIPV
jgi:hypothetical protein